MAYELFRRVLGRIDFSMVRREEMVYLQSVDGVPLTDIFMRLRIGPALESHHIFLSAWDIRLYYGEHDISRAVAELLRDAANDLGDTVLRAAYQRGARAYIDYATKLKQLSDPDAERAVMDGIIANGQIADMFLALGDPNIGRAGCLHPLNFAYQHIPLAPVSITDALRRAIGDEAALDNVTPKVLTISQGSSPTRDPDGVQVENYIGGGHATYDLECAYQNPLLDKIEHILRELRGMRRQVDSLRTNQLQPISQMLSEIEQDVRTGDGATTSQLRKLEKTVRRIASPS